MIIVIKRFESMKKTTLARNIKDVKIGKSDFIFQHKNTKFVEVYTTQEPLGEGIIPFKALPI